MTYNNWQNYQTWAVNLWIGDAPDWYTEVEHLAGRASDPYELAGELKRFIDTLNPLAEQPPSLWRDLIDRALSEVDWFALAEHLYNEVHPNG